MPRIRSVLTALLFATLATLALSARADPMGDAMAAVLRKDYPNAVRLLEPLARSGNPQAQMQLGTLQGVAA